MSAMHTCANRVALRKALARCGLVCDELDEVDISDCALGRRDVEQLVGVAVAEQLAAEEEKGCGAGGAAAGSTSSKQTQAEAARAAAAAEPDAEAEHMPQDGALGAKAAAAEPPEASLAAAVPDQPAAAAALGAPEVAAAAAAMAATAAEPIALQQQQHTVAAEAPWRIQAKHLVAAAEAVRRVQAEAAPQTDRAAALSSVASDQYEKQLLSEVGGQVGQGRRRVRAGGVVAVGMMDNHVRPCSPHPHPTPPPPTNPPPPTPQKVIPPEEIDISFEDIGALEQVGPGAGVAGGHAVAGPLWPHAWMCLESEPSEPPPPPPHTHTHTHIHTHHTAPRSRPRCMRWSSYRCSAPSYSRAAA